MLRFFLLICLIIPAFVFGGTRFLVVHPINWEGSERVRLQIEEMLQEFDQVTWVQSNASDEPWPFTRKPDSIVVAPAGIIAGCFDEGCFEDDEIYMVGGYYRACFRNTIVSLQQDHETSGTIRIIYEGVYYSSQRTLAEQAETQDMSDEELVQLLDSVDGERIEIVR